MSPGAAETAIADRQRATKAERVVKENISTDANED